ncbi:MAG TPA: zinc ribbon domain-containing protein [Vicinamibacterales bacterium]|nr:zinc ribbon domain-containing protein [Vicinamibacterales bacterium]HOQ59357.1 zinc ribbon domain-containing protein [Vicinamibacterales bacterium]HPK71411.1 zinc ribbon domain-containing protein [Vicinamibacterales bacterium]
MPIYEYQCRSCRGKTTALVLVRERESEVRCSRCGGADLEKLWSRFASPKSEEARLDALADPAALAGIDENDPKSVASFMKKMGQEMGEDVGDIEQAMEEEMAGGAAGADESGGPDDGGPVPGGSFSDDL